MQGAVESLGTPDLERPHPEAQLPAHTDHPRLSCLLPGLLTAHSLVTVRPAASTCAATGAHGLP